MDKATPKARLEFGGKVKLLQAKRAPDYWLIFRRFSAVLIREIKEHSIHRSLKPCTLFVGPIASGKSSLVNTLLSAGANDLVYKAETGSDESMLTWRFTRYDGIENLNNVFRVCDTTGILTSVDKGIRGKDLLRVMNGHVATGYKFRDDVDIADDDPHYVKEPKETDKSHCLAIVISSKQIDAGDLPMYAHKIKAAIRAARATGISTMIILTKVDLLCKTLKRDSTKIFACPHVEYVVKKISELLGVPEGLIFPVINYTSERSKHESIAIDILALLALRRMTMLAGDYLEGNELD